ncbi:uncharacterized protein LOC125225537 [Leguminivora glycinivorella]|uniref:uncharacterized protein LOC125225537 n=1 Tax=Leguminivora glycinivorella TaxID=1035111 RepID=UPI0020100282|nr:uncharacterized protein LOC125225537 [Leguminivora glycinivorella]
MAERIIQGSREHDHTHWMDNSKITAFSDNPIDDHVCSNQYNNDDNDDNEDVNSSSDQQQEDPQTTDVTNTREYGMTSQSGARRQYVTSRGRITEKPDKYDY